MNHEKFQQSLEKIYPGQRIELIGFNKPIQTSHDVYFVNCLVEDEEQKLVYKIYPELRPEYKRPDLSREVAVLRGIEESGEIVVPHVLYADFSKEILPRDYFVMNKVSGTSLSERLNEVKEIPEKKAIIREMAELLVIIHGINLANFPSLVKTNYALITLQRIETISSKLAPYSKSIGFKRLSLIKASTESLRKIMPEKTDSGLLNGDIDTAHIIKQADGGYAVIDWDPAEIGDRSWDIYWMAKAAPHLILGYAGALDDFISFYENKNNKVLSSKRYYEHAALMWSYVLGMFIENTIADHVSVPIIRQLRPMHENMLEEMVSGRK
jgi:aminoglycoside phosphotransferase (APT) family kinase protein